MKKAKTPKKPTFRTVVETLHDSNFFHSVELSEDQVMLRDVQANPARREKSPHELTIGFYRLGFCVASLIERAKKITNDKILNYSFELSSDSFRRELTVTLQNFISDYVVFQHPELAKIGTHPRGDYHPSVFGVEDCKTIAEKTPTFHAGTATGEILAKRLGQADVPDKLSVSAFSEFGFKTTDLLDYDAIWLVVELKNNRTIAFLFDKTYYDIAFIPYTVTQGEVVFKFLPHNLLEHINVT